MAERNPRSEMSVNMKSATFLKNGEKYTFEKPDELRDKLLSKTRALKENVVLACNLHVAGLARINDNDVMNLCSKCKIFFLTNDHYKPLGKQVDELLCYFSSDNLTEDVAGSGISFSEIKTYNVSLLETKGQIEMSGLIANRPKNLLVNALKLNQSDRKQIMKQIRNPTILDDDDVRRLQRTAKIRNLCIVNSVGLILYSEFNQETAKTGDTVAQFVKYAAGEYSAIDDFPQELKIFCDKCGHCIANDNPAHMECRADVPKNNNGDDKLDSIRVADLEPEKLVKHVAYAKCQTIKDKLDDYVVAMGIVIVKIDDEGTRTVVLDEYYPRNTRQLNEGTKNHRVEEEDKEKEEIIRHLSIDVERYYNEKNNRTEIKTEKCHYCEKAEETPCREVYSLETDSYAFACKNHEVNHKGNVLPVYFADFDEYDSKSIAKEFLRYRSQITHASNASVRTTGKSVANIKQFNIPIGRIVYLLKDNTTHLPKAATMVSEFPHVFTPERVWRSPDLPSDSYRENPNPFSDEFRSGTMKQVYSLAEKFEEYRNECLKEISLDPVQHYGGPAMGWYRARQIMTKNLNTLPWIPPRDVYLMLQHNLRGGMVLVMTRNAKNEDGAILGFDVNTMYASVMMSEKLPNEYLGRIENVKDIQSELEDEKFRPGVDKVIVYKANVRYPIKLHDNAALRANPPAPVKYMERLCGTFADKNDYIMLDATKEYLESVHVEVEVTEAYAFVGECLFREYVKRNINKRKNSKNPLIKDLYKLMNNSVFGKTCENVFKYKEHVINTDDSESALFKATGFVVLDGNTVMFEKPVEDVLLNKNPQMGFAILEHAKIIMYKFFAALAKTFPNIVYLYADTDSVFFQVPDMKHDECLRFIQDSEELKPMLDLNVKNGVVDPPKKTPGLWSLEYPNCIITEFIGLKPKMYYLKMHSIEKRKDKDVMRQNGMKGHTVNKETIDYDWFKWQSEIRTDILKIHTNKNKNLIVDCGSEEVITDFKRFTTLDGKTIPWGYLGNEYKHLHEQIASTEKELQKSISNPDRELFVCNRCNACSWKFSNLPVDDK